MRRVVFATALASALAACGTGGTNNDSTRADPAGATEDMRPYAGISEGETVHFTGTEPFWGGEVGGGMLTYTTPENQRGTEIPVERFAGRNGVSWSGTLERENLTLAVTPGDCSDGMSDRHYPFAAMLSIGSETREGCAWTDAEPATGPGA